MRQAGKGTARAPVVQAAVALDFYTATAGKKIPFIEAVLDVTVQIATGGTDNLRGEILLGNFVNAF
jgi:hypothetical protein